MKSLNIKFYTLYLLLAFLFTTGMQCKKTSETIKEDNLPAETQTGKGSFGCLVNGKVWLPKGKFPYAGLTASIQFGGLNLIASQSNEGINVGIGNLNIEGDYQLSGQNAEYSVGTNFYKSVEGKLTITKYDKVNQIISGRFNFKVKDLNGQTIDISDGRFDLKYTN